MRLTSAVAFGLTVGLLALAAGQAATAQAPLGATTGRFVAIGCVSRQGTTAPPRYVLTDSRGESPTTYRLNGDAALLAQHVGHLVEAAGPLTAPAPTARGTNAAPTLKVDSLVWLASTCPTAR